MAKQTEYQKIWEQLQDGICPYGNFNTSFFIYEGAMIMCEYHKDCKYTTFSCSKKFARRINRFLKTGYESKPGGVKPSHKF